MTARIQVLTASQEASLPAFRDEWLARGLATGPVDRPRIEAAVADCYRAVGMDPPNTVLWMGSPLGGCFASAAMAALAKQPQLWDQLWDQLSDQLWGQLWDQLWDQLSGQLRGQHDIPWVAWWSFAEQIGVRLTDPQTLWLAGMRAISDSGWWWPRKGCVILTERPSTLHRDAQGRLHCEHEMATSYPDGWGVWAVHGTRVDQRIIESPDTLTPAEILGYTNTEVRRVAIERYGWDRFVPDSGMRLVDSAPDPANAPHTLDLYDAPEGLLGFPARVLLCTNASPERDGTVRRFGLTVPADMPSDAVAAAAWTFGLGRDTYAGLERAS